MILSSYLRTIIVNNSCGHNWILLFPMYVISSQEVKANLPHSWILGSLWLLWSVNCARSDAVPIPELDLKNTGYFHMSFGNTEHLHKTSYYPTKEIIWRNSTCPIYYAKSIWNFFLILLENLQNYCILVKS